MNTKTMQTRKAYFVNEHAIMSEMQRIKSVQPEMLALAQTLDGTPIDPAEMDLMQFVTAPYDYVVGYLPAETQQMLAHFEDPKTFKWSSTDFHGLLQWVKKLAQGDRGGFVLSYWRRYDLATGQLKPDVEAEVRELYTERCISDRQEAVLMKIEQAVQLLNEAQQEGGHWLSEYGDRENLSQPFTRESKLYTVSSGFIAKFR